MPARNRGRDCWSCVSWGWLLSLLCVPCPGVPPWGPCGSWQFGFWRCPSSHRPGAEAAFVTWHLPGPRSSSCARAGQPGEAAGQVCCLCRPLAAARDVSKRVSPSCWLLLGGVPSDGFSRSFFPQSLCKSGKQDVAAAWHTVSIGTLGAGAGAGGCARPRVTAGERAPAAAPSPRYDQMNVSAGGSRPAPLRCSALGLDYLWKCDQ